MRLIYFALLELFFLSAVAQDKLSNKITITGKVNGDTKGYNKVYVYGDGFPSDSAVIQNGTFKFILPYKSPGYLLFYTEYDIRKHGGYGPFAILIDRPGNVNVVTKDIDQGLTTSKLSGLKSAMFWQEFSTAKKIIYKKITDGVATIYGKGWVPEGDPDYEKINNARDSMLHIYLNSFISKFIKDHRDSYVSLFVLYESKNLLTPSEMEDNYKMILKPLRYTKKGRNVADFINGLKNAVIGHPVKNFLLNDPTGKPFRFEQLKGKYVVIDFWASWCIPCRKSFPHMREVYKQLKGKNVEFYSISIDKDKNAWLKAVEIENNAWIQTMDIKNISVKEFAVTDIPTTFLIDPDGKIVLEEIGFNPDRKGLIEKKLEDLCGDKN
jgi:thiol-disulfide isomerase/thioredoxin